MFKQQAQATMRSALIASTRFLLGVPKCRRSDHALTFLHSMGPILVLSSLLLSGCECLHSTQFHICPNTSSKIEEPAVQQRDVMPVLRDAATQLGLEERNWPLRVNGAFCLFSEPTNGLSSGNNALWFGARSAGALIIVDTGLWNPGCKRERRLLFEHADRVLESNLLNAFPQRVIRLEKDDDRIP